MSTFKAPGSKDSPFTEVVRVFPELNTIIPDLKKPDMWKVALCRLYLKEGKFMPEDAKTKGAYFGYCDENGVQTPASGATHFGWTAA